MINTRNDLGTRRADRAAALVVGIALALAALALLTRGASGQEVAATFDLHGTVVDAETGSALVGAWVSPPGSEWGSISDDRGRFRIPEVGPGPIVLTVDQLGYETLRWEGEVTADGEPPRLKVTPQPILLEGLQVVTDRFRSRRNAVATSVFAFDRDDLTVTSQETALDFVSLRTGGATSCNGIRGNSCLFVRGRYIEPRVVIDEAPVLGGLEYLDSFAPHELYLIEIYGGGRHIRAYTPRFMERAARTRLAPIPFTF